MKLTLTSLLLAILFLGVVPAGILAQSSEQEAAEGLTDNLARDIIPVIKDTDGLQIKLIENLQNPETKEIIFDVIIYSQIRSDRVQVNWTLEGVTQLITPVNQISFKVDPGSVKKFQIRVKPRSRGISDLNIKVEAFENEGTYLATAFQKIYSLGNGERLPRTDEYYRIASIVTVKDIASTSLRVFGLLFLGVAGFGVFRRWLDLKEAQLDIDN